MNYFIITLLLFPLLANGQKNWQEEFPKNPDNYITDQQDILSKTEKDLLNAKLRDFEDSTSNQLFIYLAKSLDGKDLEDYSKEIFNTWGIGQKDKNNGILIAIFIDDRVYRIQVGSGLEVALPSQLTLQIQDDEMAPHFKEKNFYKGIDAGINKLIYYSKNEYSPPSVFKQIQDSLAVSLESSLVASSISILLFIINLFLLKKWSTQPTRKRKYLLLNILFLAGSFILTVATFSLMAIMHSESPLFMFPVIPGVFSLMILCIVMNDKDEVRYDNETDEVYERRMRQQRVSSRDDSSSDGDFSGGGGGSSDSGGSSSRW